MKSAIWTLVLTAMALPLLSNGAATVAMDDSDVSPKNRKKTIAEVREKALHGDAEAQLAFGLLLSMGDGVERDPAQAVEWFRKASSQNHPSAHFMLGLSYHQGHGIERDDDAARECFRKAVTAGFDLAPVKKQYAEKLENLRSYEATATLQHIAKYERLSRGMTPETETYIDVDGRIKFYENSTLTQRERDYEKLIKDLNRTRRNRQREIDDYVKLMSLIEEAEKQASTRSSK